MTSKKLTILRLVIFYLLAFVPQLIIVPVLSNLLGEPMFTGEAAASSLTLTSGIIGMCLPALANVITRIITREGFRNNYLSLEMRGGKRKYYIISLVAPLIYMIVTAIIVLLIFCGDAESWFASEKIAVRVWAFVGQVGTTFLMFMPFFGEEFGWRAYMTPKLEELMSMPAALVVGGILWGLWHAPLTVQGHNFGVDYNGFPYLGILVMCIFCTATGALFTFLTKRTKSVIPAAIAHGINNNISFGVFITLFASEEAAIIISEKNKFVFMLPMLISVVMIGTVCFVILCKEAKKEKTPHDIMTEKDTDPVKNDDIE